MLWIRFLICANIYVPKVSSARKRIVYNTTNCKCLLKNITANFLSCQFHTSMRNNVKTNIWVNWSLLMVHFDGGKKKTLRKYYYHMLAMVIIYNVHLSDLSLSLFRDVTCTLFSCCYLNDQSKQFRWSQCHPVHKRIARKTTEIPFYTSTKLI